MLLLIRIEHEITALTLLALPCICLANCTTLNLTLQFNLVQRYESYVQHITFFIIHLNTKRILGRTLLGLGNNCLGSLGGGGNLLCLGIEGTTLATALASLTRRLACNHLRSLRW